jgi:hypothetical protein
MGNYNPRAPVILGEEWVPIRDENLAFSPAVNAIEVGSGFAFSIVVGVTDARFYINELKPHSDRGQTFMAAIYPIGTEDQSGPVSSLIVPCNAATLTNATVSGAPTAIEALATQSTSSGISLDCSQPNAGLALNFALTLDALVLTNKRILGVNLLTGTAASADITGPLRTISTSLIKLSTTATIGSTTDPEALFGRLRLESEIDRTPFGEINQFWAANSPTTIADRVPWTYAQLTRMDAVATRLFTRIETGTNRGTTANSSCYVFYAALEVIYCEEKRVAVGATQFGTSNSSHSFGAESVLGANRILIHDMVGNLAPNVAAGEYVVVLSSADVGGLNDNQAQLTSDYPDLNAVRELYSIPPHPGREVDIPFPLIDHIGDVFTSRYTDILPQLTLHSTLGTIIEPHVYGRQAAAQVYGTNTATQEIYDDISGVAASYPQVRYYARRFGDTTVPLMLTGTGVFTGNTVSITPATFDQLAEILDGWREVTLRFVNAPSMGAATGTPGWTWSANGETSGNRWEILAASAPAVSGIGSNSYNLVPAPNQLGAGTYQPPAGATVELTWMPQGVASAWVTSPTIDAATDAVLMFSQDPATVTGVTLTARTQTVTGFALDCGSLPCCIPTGIPYQQVTWAHQGLASLVEDSFTRTVVNGFGNPDIGGAYTLTDVATAYQVNGSEGTITPTVGSTTAWATVDIGSPDFDVTAQLGVVGNMLATSTARTYVGGRFTDAANNYAAFIQQVQSTGAIVLAIEKTVAGVVSNLIVVTSTLAIDGGARVNVRFMGSGQLLKVKAWALSDPQPLGWDIETSDTSLTTGNRAGVGGQSRGLTGNTIGVDNLRITVPSYWFGGYELQRYDTVEGAFDTIMLATDIMQTSFNDYESRVGINSVYRIRALNALNFAGAWSLQVTGSVPVPGVTGGCADSTGALIFTSNADQTGLHNAAYVMQWEQAPIEDFSLPEADMVQFQPMYGRDGSVAFHGTERGLERFDRVVLINAAAIDPVRLADAKTIRDLAWADLPYVCVRDEIGDRWFSSVAIPTVNARLNRTKYFARVEITEVTQTPAVVDP